MFFRIASPAKLRQRVNHEPRHAIGGRQGRWRVLLTLTPLHRGATNPDLHKFVGQRRAGDDVPVDTGSVFRLGEEFRCVLLHHSGTAWSAPGGGARSEQGCHPAPAAAAAPWLARKALEVVSPHGLKPCAPPQSPCVPHADRCPLVRRQRVPACGSDGSFRAARSEHRMSAQGRCAELCVATRS